MSVNAGRLHTHLLQRLLFGLLLQPALGGGAPVRRLPPLAPDDVIPRQLHSTHTIDRHSVRLGLLLCVYVCVSVALANHFSNIVVNRLLLCGYVSVAFALTER